MDLSIIIPSYNTKLLLERCLDSVYQGLGNGNISYEVIVVDNASHDGSQELLRKKYPRVIKILNKKNFGYGRANNIGIKKAEGTYILLINSDIVAREDSIVTLLKYAGQSDRTFFGGKLLNEDGSAQSSCGPFFSIPVTFLMLFLKGDQIGLTRYSPQTLRTVDWVSGACILGKRDYFLRVGLFDEDIFLYMEEVDFFYRARQKGYRTVFVPSARFTHTGAASSGSKRQPVVNIFRGLVYFYGKHRSIMELQTVKALLTAKARIAMAVGGLTGNRQLIQTYEEALRVV
ncbi:glycosyltransferase family 2 protein [Patescibacteria group bacterium]|nr:glycosyltransferase family 2 protein [Patescibacteria group bacterium]